MSWYKNLYFYHFVRIVLGGIFFVMGLKGLLDFNGAHAGTKEGAEFINALVATQFFWPFEKFLETLFGFLLLFNRYTGVAVNGLAGIILNIVLYHAFLDPHNSLLAIIVLLCELYLYIAFWKCSFKQSFTRYLKPW